MPGRGTQGLRRGTFVPGRGTQGLRRGTFVPGRGTQGLRRGTFVPGRGAQGLRRGTFVSGRGAQGLRRGTIALGRGGMAGSTNTASSVSVLMALVTSITMASLSILWFKRISTPSLRNSAVYVFSGATGGLVYSKPGQIFRHSVNLCNVSLVQALMKSINSGTGIISRSLAL